MILCKYILLAIFLARRMYSFLLSFEDFIPFIIIEVQSM